jgi:hypothetical protein
MRKRNRFGIMSLVAVAVMVCAGSDSTACWRKCGSPGYGSYAGYSRPDGAYPADCPDGYVPANCYMGKWTTVVSGPYEACVSTGLIGKPCYIETRPMDAARGIEGSGCGCPGGRFPLVCDCWTGKFRLAHCWERPDLYGPWKYIGQRCR